MRRCSSCSTSLDGIAEDNDLLFVADHQPAQRDRAGHRRSARVASTRPSRCRCPIAELPAPPLRALLRGLDAADDRRRSSDRFLDRTEGVDGVVHPRGRCAGPPSRPLDDDAHADPIVVTRRARAWPRSTSCSIPTTRSRRCCSAPSPSTPCPTVADRSARRRSETCSTCHRALIAVERDGRRRRSLPQPGARRVARPTPKAQPRRRPAPPSTWASTPSRRRRAADAYSVAPPHPVLQCGLRRRSWPGRAVYHEVVGVQLPDRRPAGSCSPCPSCSPRPRSTGPAPRSAHRRGKQLESGYRDGRPAAWCQGLILVATPRARVAIWVSAPARRCRACSSAHVTVTAADPTRATDDRRRGPSARRRRTAPYEGEMFVRRPAHGRSCLGPSAVGRRRDPRRRGCSSASTSTPSVSPGRAERLIGGRPAPQAWASALRPSGHRQDPHHPLPGRASCRRDHDHDAVPGRSRLDVVRRPVLPLTGRRGGGGPRRRRRTSLSTGRCPGIRGRLVPACSRRSTVCTAHGDVLFVLTTNRLEALEPAVARLARVASTRRSRCPGPTPTAGAGCSPSTARAWTCRMNDDEVDTAGRAHRRRHRLVHQGAAAPRRSR